MNWSRRQFLTAAGSSLTAGLAGCSSQSTYQVQLNTFNQKLDSPVFAYLSGNGDYSAAPTLSVDVYKNKLPATCQLQLPSGEVVDRTTITHDDDEPLERSGVRTDTLDFAGEGTYVLYGRGHREIDDAVKFTVSFSRELGVGKRVAILKHVD